MRRSGFTGAVLVAVLFSAVWVVGQEFSAEGPYLGQEPPGMAAEVFAPWLFDADESAGCSGFLDDGEVFVFSSGKTGGDWRFGPIRMTELENGMWTEPRIAPFNDFMPYNFTVGPASRTIWFTSMKSPDTTTSQLLEQANIWAVTRVGEGWTEPVMLGASLNTDKYYENYPTVSKDGTVYFMSWRPGSVGRTDIYRSRNMDGKYAGAENMGPPVNSTESDQDPFIAPDGSYLIVCLTGRDDSLGGYDLYVSFAEEDGSWSEPVNLGEGVNTPGPEFRPYVTQDGKYLFFTGLAPDDDTIGRIFWVSAEVIEVARAAQGD